MDLKSTHVENDSHPPILLPLLSAAPATISSSIQPIRFDVILLRPTGTWAETAALPIRNISSDPGFIFLWVGKGDDEGLEKGRECFAKWGFRRAEDIVWVKTNRAQASVRQKGGLETSKDDDRQTGTGGEGLFASSKEHCLMGIRGTVRRSTDTRFVHCNVDTDILVWEQDEEGTSFHLRRLILNDTDSNRSGSIIPAVFVYSNRELLSGHQAFRVIWKR
jgi:mRNA (2'-O-methyladenosine-N6-)-methyltransferase